MAEYIEREAARSVVCDVCELCGSLYCTYDCKHPIDAIPAANVVPVRHGRWKRDSQRNIICSVCGDKPFFSNSKYLNYCPNCGADMKDGDGE